MRKFLIPGILALIITSSLYLVFKNKEFKVTLPSLPKPTEAPMSMVSPDGENTLYVKKIPDTSDKQSFLYTVSASTGLSFTKSLPVSDSISIPFNSWSPDYKYIFLKEKDGGITNFYVYSSSNKEFASNLQYLNITDQFAKKLPDYKLEDITGWAAPTLLVVNTEDASGKQGPSFWFDIQTQSFIQLSTRFN